MAFPHHYVSISDLIPCGYKSEHEDFKELDEDKQDDLQIFIQFDKIYYDIMVDMYNNPQLICPGDQEDVECMLRLALYLMIDDRFLMRIVSRWVALANTEISGLEELGPYIAKIRAISYLQAIVRYKYMKKQLAVVRIQALARSKYIKRRFEAIRDSFPYRRAMTTGKCDGCDSFEQTFPRYFWQDLVMNPLRHMQVCPNCDKYFHNMITDTIYRNSSTAFPPRVINEEWANRRHWITRRDGSIEEWKVEKDIQKGGSLHLYLNEECIENELHIRMTNQDDSMNPDDVRYKRIPVSQLLRLNQIEQPLIITLVRIKDWMKQRVIRAYQISILASACLVRRPNIELWINGERVEN
uniref:Uncharacterized protein n=1 Tax=Megaviridae environmental sample TaxID=1737588 RepID=A0A5J6VID7_9VIRU|nr:MAG: hypothetical protein [Megaviridae environmental sample]